LRLLNPMRPEVDVFLEVRVLELKPGPQPDTGQVALGLRLVEDGGHAILMGTADTLVARGPGSRPVASP